MLHSQALHSWSSHNQSWVMGTTLLGYCGLSYPIRRKKWIPESVIRCYRYCLVHQLRRYVGSYPKSTFPWQLLIWCSPWPDELFKKEFGRLSSTFAWVSHFYWNWVLRPKKIEKIFFVLKWPEMARNITNNVLMVYLWGFLRFSDDFWGFLRFSKFLIFRDYHRFEVKYQDFYSR